MDKQRFFSRRRRESGAYVLREQKQSMSTTLRQRTRHDNVCGQHAMWAAVDKVQIPTITGVRYELHTSAQQTTIFGQHQTICLPPHTHTQQTACVESAASSHHRRVKLRRCTFGVMLKRGLPMSHRSSVAFFGSRCSQQALTSSETTESSTKHKLSETHTLDS